MSSNARRMIENIAVVLVITAFATGFVMLLNIIMPLWLAIIIGVVATPVVLVIVLGTSLTVAYPVMVMWMLVLWMAHQAAKGGK